MPDTDLHQPGLGRLRAAAEAAELAQAISGLVTADGYRLAVSDPLAPLARAIARALTEAGLPLHRCARHDPRYRLGGLPAAGPGRTGGSPRRDRGVVDHAHPDVAGLGQVRHLHGTQQAMNTAIGGILRAFGYPAEPFGSGGAWLVTGHRDQDPGADR